MSEPLKIVAYITSSPDRVLSGDPLCLRITDDTDLQKLLVQMGRALRVDIVQLCNGDYMLISSQ